MEKKFARGVLPALRYFLGCMLGIIVLNAYTETLTLPEITRGVQWLAAQVKLDGSLSNEAQSIALPLQNRTEAANTLKLLAAVPTTLSGKIASEQADNAEFLARKIIALAQSGADTSADISVLLKLQTEDGSFATEQGFTGNPLDSAWAVLALAQAGQGGGSAAVAARGWLLTQIQTDGALPGSSDWERIHSSALTLLALQTDPTGGDVNRINGLSSWLLQQQNADGSWMSNSYLSAVVFSAIAPLTADNTVRNKSSAFLLSRQSPDGSWDSDPYLTALILRSLSGKSSPPVSNTNATLRGKVADAANNVALPNAQVTVTLGGVSKSASTDSEGRFSIANLGGGSAALTVSRNGYLDLQAPLNLQNGQITDVGTILLNQIKSTGIIRGQVTHSGGNPLAGVTIAVSGASTAGAVTDAVGRYEIANLPAGNYNIGATLGGYQNVAGSAALVAGQTLLFSPTLYPTDQTVPSGIRYFGQVVDLDSSAPLAGVAVQIGGSANLNVATDASGRFDVNLPVGNFSAAFSLAAYSGVQQSFSGAAGSTINAGIIKLAKQQTVSSIAGKVLDSQNKPIVGVRVQIVGTDQVAVTDGNGHYRLNDLAGLNFTIRASSAGFDSVSHTLQLNRPADVNQDFTLTAASSSSLNLSLPVVTPEHVGSQTDVSVATTVSNSGSTSASAVLQLQVQDENGAVIGYGLAYDEQRNLIGQIEVAAGAAKVVQLMWNSAQFKPGNYRLVVRLLESGSITQATPLGNLIVERIGGVVIDGQNRFGGSITADPPVLQAGTNTTVKLSAVLQNGGNLGLPGQNFTLSAIDSKDNSIAYSQSLSVGETAVNGLQSLNFPDWTPAMAANYRLELSAADSALGKVIGNVYVGDAAKASYTVNKLVVPTGNQNVKAKIAVTGQDVVGGTISDPLAPLIKTAIQKAIPYSYNIATSQTLSNRCLLCHVQAQALVGGEVTRKIADSPTIRSQRDVLLNSLTLRQQEGGYIDGFGGFHRTQSMLGFWALSAWNKKEEIASTLVKGSNYLATQQGGDGRWTADHGHGWWASDQANTAVNLKFMVDTMQAVAAMAAGTAKTHSSTKIATSAGTPYYLETDNEGNVYAPDSNLNQITKIKPDGSKQTWASGLNNPSKILFNNDGSAFIATYIGVYRRSVDGALTLFSRERASGMAFDQNGVLYIGSYWDNKISKLDANGNATVFASGGALNGPIGMAFDAKQNLIVVNYNAGSILRYNPEAKVERVVDWMGSVSSSGSPRNIVAADNGWYVTSDTYALFYFSQDWHGERLLYQGTAGIARKPNDDIVFTRPGDSGIYRLDSTPVDLAAWQTRLVGNVEKATTWLQNNCNTSDGDNINLAQCMIGLNSAKQYYKGQARADALQTKLEQLGQTLRSRVRSDGGWGRYTSSGSDSMVTAQVGVALDVLNPSAKDAIVQNAIRLLLARQSNDGSWATENGILSTRFAATTWVAIWLPTVLDRLGGIDTDLNLTFAPNVTMSNPDVPVTETINNSDGSTSVRWNLIGVTNAGRTINFDLALQNMGVDEVRPVSSDAYLLFKNSFTSSVVKAPVTVPRVQASAFLDLGVATDRPAYPADTLVNIRAQVNNSGVNLSAGMVKLAIYAPDGALVTNLTDVPFTGLTAGASLDLNSVWNTGRVLAGNNYQVVASLYNGVGSFVGRAQAKFAVTPGDDGAASLLQALIRTDKQRYQPNETVKITDQISNAGLNRPFNDLRISTHVQTPASVSHLIAGESLAQLPSQSNKVYQYDYPLNFAAAGDYSARLTVSDLQGTVLAQVKTTFNVADSRTSGIGLGGVIGVSPKVVPIGDSASFAFTVSNQGNSGYIGLPLTVAIIDPQTQTVLAEYPYQTDLAQNAQFSGGNGWATSTAKIGDSYLAVLKATVGGKSLTLAQDNFTIAAPPIKLDTAVQGVAGGRVLVLLACNDGEQEPACLVARRQIVEQTLQKLGVRYLITTTEVEFRSALRSGLYNVYWLSGKQDKLHTTVPAEIREAVNRGDSLLQDGVHDERNKALDAVAGIIWRGKIGPTDLPVDIATPDSVTQLQMSGRGLKIELDGAVEQGAFNGGKPNSNGPALVLNRYGAGKAYMYAFDLVSSIAARNAWQANLGDTLAAILPPQADHLPAGSGFALQTMLQNQARAVDVRVVSQLPNPEPFGAKLLWAEPAAQYDELGRIASWNFRLPENATQTIDWLIQVPGLAGNYSIVTQANSVIDGVVKPYGTAITTQFSVADSVHIADVAAGQIRGLPVVGMREQKARDAALVAFEHAHAAAAQNTPAGYDSAIGYYLAAIDNLASLSANIQAVRSNIDILIKDAAWRWTQTK